MGPAGVRLPLAGGATAGPRAPCVGHGTGLPDPPSTVDVLCWDTEGGPPQAEAQLSPRFPCLFPGAPLVPGCLDVGPGISTDRSPGALPPFFLCLQVSPVVKFRFHFTRVHQTLASVALPLLLDASSQGTGVL